MSTEPGPPQNLHGVPDFQKSTIIWEAPLDNGGSSILNYKLYRALSLDGTYILTATTIELFKTDLDVTGGAAYWYKVSAVNSVGEGELTEALRCASLAGEIYREIDVTCGMGDYPTVFTSPVINVKTENDIARLRIVFPRRFMTSSYRKIIDLGFYTTSEVYNVESRELTYDGELEKYTFIINREYTYGDRLYFQFRALLITGQEAVDPGILYLKFRDSIKTVDFESIDSAPTSTQTEILEDFVQQHGNVNASTIHTGHVRIDNDTIVISGSGVISTTFDGYLSIHIDNETIIINGSGIISAPYDIADHIDNKTIITNTINKIEQNEDEDTRILDTWGHDDSLDNMDLKVDSDDNFHVIFDIVEGHGNPGEIIYATNRNPTGHAYKKVSPKAWATVDKEQPDTHVSKNLFIMGGTSEQGVLFYFDPREIPPEENIIKAELHVPIYSLEVEQILVDGQWEARYYPCEADVFNVDGYGFITGTFAFTDAASIEYWFTSTGDYRDYNDNLLNASSSWIGAAVYYDEYMTSQGDPIGCDVYRGLLKPDLTSLIVGEEYDNISLILRVLGSTTDKPSTVGLYRVTEDWDGSTVTWNNQPTYDSTPILTFDANIAGEILLDVTTYLQNYLNGTYENYGWLFKCVDETGMTPEEDYRESWLQFKHNFYTPPIVFDTWNIFSGSGTLPMWDKDTVTWNQMNEIRGGLLDTFSCLGMMNTALADITSTVLGWASGTQVNNGVYLTVNSYYDGIWVDLERNTYGNDSYDNVNDVPYLLIETSYTAREHWNSISIESGAIIDYTSGPQGGGDFYTDSDGNVIRMKFFGEDAQDSAIVAPIGISVPYSPIVVSSLYGTGYKIMRTVISGKNEKTESVDISNICDINNIITDINVFHTPTQELFVISENIGSTTIDYRLKICMLSGSTVSLLYTGSNTRDVYYDYIGGTGKTIVEDFYYSYVSRQETSDSIGTYIEFKVNLITRINGIWSESTVFTYDPLRDPSGDIMSYPEDIYNILVTGLDITDGQITIAVPIYRQHASSGSAGGNKIYTDILVLRNSGNNWYTDFIDIMENDPDSRTYPGGACNYLILKGFINTEEGYHVAYMSALGDTPTLNDAHEHVVYNNYSLTKEKKFNSHGGVSSFVKTTDGNVHIMFSDITDNYSSWGASLIKRKCRKIRN